MGERPDIDEPRLDWEFRGAVCAALDTMSPRDVGQRFGVCATTVERWREGKSLPVPSAQRSVLRVLRARAWSEVPHV